MKLWAKLSFSEIVLSVSSWLMVIFSSHTLSLHLKLVESSYNLLQKFWCLKFGFCFIPAMTDKVKYKKVKLSKLLVYKERKNLEHGDKQFWCAIKEIQKEEARQDHYDRVEYNVKLRNLSAFLGVNPRFLFPVNEDWVNCISDHNTFIFHIYLHFSKLLFFHFWIFF